MSSNEAPDLIEEEVIEEEVIEEEVVDEEVDHDLVCTICGEIRRAETATFVCDHKFCQECIVFWYRKCVAERRQPTCPLCRKVDDVWGTR